MLISITGSQGAGKSTLITELENRGFLTVQRKTSRSIMAEWNVTLEQVNNDHDLTIKFQDEILKRKSEDETKAVNSSYVWITERTYADLFTYALITLGKENKYSQWIDEYYEKCKQAQETYDGLVYLTSGQFEIQHDGVRGSNQHYGRMVDLIMDDVTLDITRHCPIRTLTRSDMNYRIHEVENMVENIVGNGTFINDILNLQRS